MIRPVALAAITALAALAFIAVGCQTYDFEPVTPLTLAQTTQREGRIAKPLKPNIMLLVDTSGSMEDPIDKNDSRCPTGCGSNSHCPPACPTRMSDLRNAMSAFLGSSSGTIARLGVTFFPADAQCGPPNAASAPQVPLPDKTTTDDGTDMVLAANATRIATQLTAKTPNGGTPTAAALSFVGGLRELNDASDGRDDFILLMTDGLPNCNAQNPNQQCVCNEATCGAGSCANNAPVCQAQKTACQCTLSSCAGNCAMGCLDQDGTVGQIKTLLTTQGIKTIVVGFGADTAAGPGAAVLQAMGEAGGFAPRCPKGTDEECGVGNTCDRSKNACVRKFYQASNRDDLVRALEEITRGFVKEPCTFLLDDKPSDPRYLAVLVNDMNVPQGPDTWTYSETRGTVTFAETSSYCAAMKASTPNSPVPVEIRIIQQL